MLDQVAAHLVNSANAANARGEFAAAAASCQQALKIAPKLPEAWYHLGRALRGQRQSKAAIAALEKAATLTAGSADAQNNIGLELLEAGAYVQSQRCFARAVKLAPGYVIAHSNMGLLFERQKKLDQAELHFRKTVELAPEWVLAHVHLAGILNAQKRHVEAEVVCRAALAIDEQCAAAWSNLSSVLRSLDNCAEAETAARRALELSPMLLDGWCNLGAALAGLHRHQEAETVFSKAVEMDATSASAWAGLANALGKCRSPAAAAAAWERALALDETTPEFWVAYGSTQLELRQYGQSIASFERASAAKPGPDFLPGLLQHARMQACRWGGFEQQMQQLIVSIGNREKVSSPFAILGLLDSPELHYEVARIWAEQNFPEKEELGPIPPRHPREKIRIGYFSADLHNHATAYLMAELFELHNRSNFEIYAFSYGPEVADAMRSRLTQAFDRWVDIRAHTDKAAALLARELEIDIAVDLKGYTQDGRVGIFAYRAAPVQLSYLGYPGTLAVPYMDYIVADGVVIPESGNGHYSEKIVRLPHSYQINDRRRNIAAEMPTRAELGLPDQAFVFCCFNQTYKILPPTFAGWMRILQRVPGSVLWVYADHDESIENLRRESMRHGVDAERLVFAGPVPLEQHLARLTVADLFLDTLPYNAHTTTSDALWAGLPVLTCMGASFASRVAASLLKAVDLPELVSNSQDDFEARAVEFAKHPELLGEIRQKLQKNRLVSPLFDTPRFARGLEQAYMTMQTRRRKGLLPDHIAIEP